MSVMVGKALKGDRELYFGLKNYGSIMHYH